MKKVAIGIFGMLIGYMLISCAEPATQEELKNMCENLTSLRGKIEKHSVKALVGKAEEEFKKREEHLKAWMERDLKGWDDELEEKLKETKTDAEKESLKSDYEKKKEVTRQQHLPGIEELKPEKESALKEAKQKADDSLAEWNSAVDECVATALKEGTSKETADCKTKAKSTDEYWNKCK